MYIGRINIALNDIQNRDVATLLAWNSGHHSVFGLEKSTHNIQDCGLSYSLSLLEVIACEWCVRGHKEMAARSRYQRGNNANEVIVHIARVSEGGCAG